MACQLFPLPAFFVCFSYARPTFAAPTLIELALAITYTPSPPSHNTTHSSSPVSISTNPFVRSPGPRRRLPRAQFVIAKLNRAMMIQNAKKNGKKKKLPNHIIINKHQKWAAAIFLCKFVNMYIQIQSKSKNWFEHKLLFCANKFWEISAPIGIKYLMFLRI